MIAPFLLALVLAPGTQPSEISTAKPLLFGVSDPESFDIPVDDHPNVARWIKYFQGRGREHFRRWLSRKSSVEGVYMNVMETFDLPRDLLYLSMVESGFSTQAYSWAHAVGPWQFIPETARRYGLAVDLWVDERRDLEKSTVAAARYLSELHEEFGDWYLAWAAYNGGENRIRKAIQRTGTRDFWNLSKGRHLAPETRQYVPKLLAAALISKNYQAYGIEEPEFLDPQVADVLTVTVATDLATIAKACGPDVSVDELSHLNPELYRKITPPDRSYDVRVPKFWVRDCEDGLLQMTDRPTFRYHSVRRGDTVNSIAKDYGTTPAAILSYNGITEREVSRFDGIVVPMSLSAAAALPKDGADATCSWRKAPPYTPGVGKKATASSGGRAGTVMHRVRSGDNLSAIARKYRVSVAQLRAWNGLSRRNNLRVGERIIVHGSRS